MFETGLKGPFTPKMITVRVNILPSTPNHDTVLFIISARCSFVFCGFKCLSSLKSGTFCLAVVTLKHTFPVKL